MPDPHLVDIERIEVLPGPQGTLFGASSESGTVRVITNKPKLDTFEGSLESTGSTVSHGGLGYDVNGMVNVPIVDDVLALRISAFDMTTPGYIDEVPSGKPTFHVGREGPCHREERRQPATRAGRPRRAQMAGR